MGVNVLFVTPSYSKVRVVDRVRSADTDTDTPSDGSTGTGRFSGRPVYGCLGLGLPISRTTRGVPRSPSHDIPNSLRKTRRSSDIL